MDIKLHNTLTGQKEEFTPIESSTIKMYHCGPTVYGEQHIGNLSMFVFTDILRRTLEYGGYKVRQVINFTDFGHLTGDNLGDADTGEDKIQRGLKREGLEISMQNMKILAEKYAKVFLEDIATLNIKTLDTIFPYASEYLPDQINLIKTLEQKGFAYEESAGVYFDTSKFPNYGKLGNINLEGLQEGARIGENKEKRNPTDFLLWKKDTKMGWPSPWGMGFPGWHIECSAMIIKILGEQIDIHTGGIEHIPVHHNNEIAQSEAATGKEPFSKFWLHRAHLKIDDSKISKSLGNTVLIKDLVDKKIHPLSFRYWLLTSHYSTPNNFTWEGVTGSQSALEKIIVSYSSLPDSHGTDKYIQEQFEEAISDNLNTPVAVAVFQEAKSKEIIEKMDKVLGLNIKTLSENMYDIPNEILEIKKERDIARENKDWHESDRIRKDLEQRGFVVEDKENESIIRKTLASVL